MRIVALDNYDNVEEGTEYECPDGQAQRLIAKGLAKAGPIPKNKMAPVAENKQNPTEAVGEGQPSSVSQAAQAFTETTSLQSNVGEIAAAPAAAPKPRGRPRKVVL